MKINSALPKGDADGLTALEGQMLKKQKPIVALVILEPATIDEDLKTHDKSLKVSIRRIEALLPDDVEPASRLLQRAFESRTGETTLPIELEDDIKDALKGIDTYMPATEVQETVIDVPEGGYPKMTVPLLRALLKRRGLDHSQGTKTELIGRLEWSDASPEDAKPTNVTSIFNDGTVSSDVVDDEPIADEDVPMEYTKDGPEEEPTDYPEPEFDPASAGLEPVDVDSDEEDR